MNRNKTPFALVLIMLALFAVFLVSCGTLQRTLFTAQPVLVTFTNAPPPGSTNPPTIGTNSTQTLQPNAQLVRTVQDTAGLFGPYGAAFAGLFTSGLGLYASWHNRRALQNHMSEPARPPPTV